MRYLVALLILVFFVACSPDQKLVEENEKLKAQNEMLISELEQRTADALAAQAEAERQVEMAQANLAEANRQRQEAVKLAEKLKNCQ